VRRESVHERIKRMAASGLVEDQIALKVGVDKNELRAKYIEAIKAGKADAAETEANETAISKSDYFLLDAIHTAFSSPFHDPVRGNLLWLGCSGKGALTIEDAFARRKAADGAFSTAGIFKKMQPEKMARYAEIVRDFNNNQIEEMK
jgi:hypothetical protein